MKTFLRRFEGKPRFELQGDCMERKGSILQVTGLACNSSTLIQIAEALLLVLSSQTRRHTFHIFEFALYI
jgi:hypothetical protein